MNEKELQFGRFNEIETYWSNKTSLLFLKGLQSELMGY